MFGFGRDKGEISIKLTSYNFSPGDLIEGVVTLKVKKPVKAEGVNIGLVGRRIVASAGPNEIGRLFDSRQPLDSAREYQPGEQDYPFKIRIPEDILTPDTLSRAAKALLSFTAGSSYVVWELIANLPVHGGRDVSKTVQINIA